MFPRLLTRPTLRTLPSTIRSYTGTACSSPKPIESAFPTLTRQHMRLQIPLVRWASTAAAHQYHSVAPPSKVDNHRRPSSPEQMVFELLNSAASSKLPSWEAQMTGANCITLSHEQHPDHDLIKIACPQDPATSRHISARVDADDLGAARTAAEWIEVSNGVTVSRWDRTDSEWKMSQNLTGDADSINISASFPTAKTQNVMGGADLDAVSFKQAAEQAAKQFAAFSRYNVNMVTSPRAHLAHASDIGTDEDSNHSCLSSFSPPQPRFQGEVSQLSSAASSTAAAALHRMMNAPQSLQSPYQLQFLKPLVYFPIRSTVSLLYVGVYMVRTLLNFARPFIAFGIMGEVMKILAVSIFQMQFVFLFSFVLAFEVGYFFLQCYISYMFLGMFFSSVF